MSKYIYALFSLILLTNAAWADPLDGKKTITMKANRGDDIVIGTIDFKKSGEQSSFSLHLTYKLFTDHFLSMKEFKCLEGDTELSCYVPYPYKNPMIASANDLSWLEHALLFLKKDRKEFGANLWNGMLYKMTIKGETIEGELRDIDLNLIASPPEDLTVAPYNEDEQVETDLGSRWLPRIIIR